jgi:UDP-glucuronate 4-epimerase
MLSFPFCILEGKTTMRPDFNQLDTKQTYLVTGAAGFVGYHLSRRLLSLGCTVIGFDNLNDYYDVSLKQDRLEQLAGFPSFAFVKGDLADKEAVDSVFSLYKPAVVVNLAAQAGVRYSIENPAAYVQSNLVGFANILEACRQFPVTHLVYASSSSVYGMNDKIPFSTEDKVDNPVSLYAATKKSNELMAHCYTHLYGIPSTGLRFFTVYGPFGRPDMAYFSFSRKIMAGEPIKVFNNGDMYRDFTYIDDIVHGVEQILCNPPIPNEHGDRYKIYNIGNNKPEKLMYFIETLEHCLGKQATKEFLPMQPGDVYRTYADVSDLMEDFDFKPDTPLADGLQSFVAWFKEYCDLD